MKKLYTLALAAVCALGLSAQEQLLTAQCGVFKPKREAKKVELQSLPNGMQRAQAAAPALNDILGDYTWVSYNLLGEADEEGNPPLQYYDITIEKSGVSGVKITGLYGSYPVTGTYNKTAGTLTLRPQVMFTHATYGEVSLLFPELDNESNITNYATSLVATWDDECGFVFDENSSMGIGCEYEGRMGWFRFGYANVFSFPIEFEEPDASLGMTWESVGYATFCDGWQVASYGVNQFEYPWEVEVEKAVESDYLYRLVNPYNIEDCPILEKNVSKVGGYLIFSLDPELPCMVPGIYAGIEDEYGHYYQYDLPGYAHFYGGLNADDTEAWLDEQGVEPSTLEDGLFTVPFSVMGMSYTTMYQPQYFECDDPTSTIDFGEILVGVQTVSADRDVNAPVEFFNLQGMRVDNPTPGIYVRRNGAKVSKVLVR